MLKRFQSLLLNKDDYESKGYRRPPENWIIETEISQIQQQRLVNRVACEQYQLHQQEEEKISEKKKIDIDHHVQKGIEYHELDELEKATHQFRIAAKEESPIGMLLYGLSLRHGWGCRVNSTLAFQYLQKAAEYAVDGLQKGSSSCYNNENTKNKMDTLLATRKGELVIAIYELGVALQQGWGTTRSPETAFYYFKVAAQLGDADAQNEVADCYYRGYGTKKDLYQAATYYRLAASQGRGLIGNSWIYKSKYDNNNNTNNNNNNNNANTNININNNKNNKNS